MIRSLTTAAATMNLRVLSYNVLSSHLAPASSYPTCNPDHLLASNRLPVILEKLESEIKADPHNTVVCLQEVSYEWAGAFHTFFANKGFHLVTGNYGKTFNGYMGVCTAWPTADYEVLDVDICRLADTREEGWPKFEKKSFVDGVVARFSGLLDGAMKQVGWKEDKETPPDHWTLSQRRFNVLVTTTLRDKKSGQAFSIGNYHMPCAYYCPMAMTLHADLCARRVQAVAANFEAPSVLAGDFNIKPSEPVYRFLTAGEMETTSPFYPTPKGGMDWKPTSQPMRSAYAVQQDGKEPDFTNYASRSVDEEPFIDTLDYIFLCGDKWTVSDVLSIPNRDDSQGPFPNLDVQEPSDHVMIAATLSYK